jgi:hypothetical protein
VTPSASVARDAANEPAYHLGFNFDHTGDFNRAMNATQVAASLDALKALGVTHISITPSFFQDTLESTAFFWKRDRAAMDNEVRDAIRLARARGLFVLLKPHLWLEKRGPDIWRGKINPQGDAWATWSAAYKTVLLEYAELAAAEQCAGFCLGSELTEVATRRAEFWRDLAASVRTKFPGWLTYAANWYQEFEKIAWWDAVDRCGVDAFYPIVDKSSEPVTHYTAMARMRKIRKTIMAVGEKVSRPVLLCEVGYKATPNTARQPWEWHDAATQPVDLAVQKTLYEAVRDVFDPDRDPDAARMGGLYFWKWCADLDWGGAENSDFTPHGKPAEETIRDWFSTPRKKAGP